jgi:hypothetical protein
MKRRVVLVILGLALLVPLWVPAPALAENDSTNGTWWAADGPAHAGVAVSGTLANSGDVDWYYFYVGTTCDVTVSYNSSDYSASFAWYRFNGGTLVEYDSCTYANHWSTNRRLEPGLYYVKFSGGSGAYDFTASGFQSTTLTISTPLAEVSYGQPLTLSGRLAGGATALSGKLVVPQYSYDNAAWTSLASTRTDAYGTYRFRVTPTRRTYYRVRYNGGGTSLVCTSRVVSTLPRVYLTTPSLSATPTLNQSVTLAGFLKPKHAAGASSVQLKCYRYQAGVWVYVKTAYATNRDYSTYTRYAAATPFAARGAWRVRAYHPADSSNAATYSGWKYFTVR